jgi:hypothetical protein
MKKMRKYINIKTSEGVETIEEMHSTDYPSIDSFKAALTTRIGSYRMIFKRAAVYASQRCSNEWTGN